MKLAVALALALTAAAQTPKYEVHRAPSKIIVDGRATDPAWAAAAPAVEFIFPWENQKGAKQKTTARLLWDNDNLYVIYQCEDADIVAHYTQLDDPTYKDDAVEFFVNPKPSQNFYYGLEMNARATLYDYFYAHPHLLLKRVNFTGVQLATNIDGTLNQTGDKDRGWVLELAIPWKNFEELGATEAPKPGAIWTANLNRWDGVEPARRLSLWSDPAMKNPTPHNPARFGQLHFVD